MKSSLFVPMVCALLFCAGCAAPTVRTAARVQPGQRAMAVFKITHFDRVGESSSVIARTGDIVTVERDGRAVNATGGGDILHCPARALHPIGREIGAALAAKGLKAPDWIAAEELQRWFPADGVPFTLRWLSPGEIAKIVPKAEAMP